MRARNLISIVFAAAGCSHTKSVTPEPEHYTITEHIVVPQADSDLQRDEHTLTYCAEILKVRYTDSQTSHAKPDNPANEIHSHTLYSDPDLSQVPPAGMKIRACLLEPERDKYGGLVISRQPTSEPCMARIGNTLKYEPSPNGPDLFSFVDFEILSEKATSAPRP